MIYRKKPVEVEAFRFVKGDSENMPAWLAEAINTGEVRIGPVSENTTLIATIQTLEGIMTAYEGDWIIQGVNGELYPCKNDIFEKTYDAKGDCFGRMTDSIFIAAAQCLVSYYSNNVLLTEKVAPKEVYVVWSCKTLQNFKGLFGTHCHDGRYFEVTYDGDKQMFYFDAYIKEHNQAMPLNEVINMDKIEEEESNV